MVIFECLPSENLLECRRANHVWGMLANNVIYNRIQEPLHALELKSASLQASFKTLQVAKAPQLTHYSDFLSQAVSSDIAEMTWFNAPPPEIRTVCECLVRLRDPNLNDQTPLSWQFLKRAMSKYEFKVWYANLQTNVSAISIDSTTFVENIIRTDPSITYERLREVSLTGYRMLIQVAAALQYSNINFEISSKKFEMEAVERIRFKTRRFVNCLNKRKRGARKIAPAAKPPYAEPPRHL